jgi:flavorubredoxin/rubredoxin
MYCTRKVKDDVVWVGGNDRRLSLFEGVYSVPNGISYNSYLLLDESTVLFDTVDRAVEKVFFENVEHELGGRPLDYVVIHHMEPDHSATLETLLRLHPETTVVCNQMILTMMRQFFGFSDDRRVKLVREGDTLKTGRHILSFLMAPMVHWPEVMMTFDKTDGTLFSADAFGTFGALNGALFADEVDFAADYMDEARRYYCNIVGKYGDQVSSLLKKMSECDIKTICPLHGFVWRKDIGVYTDKYRLWSSYAPEEKGVMIAYASVYGNTANTADIIACRLRDRGIKTVMFDVSVAPVSDIVAAAFRYSHLLFASTTYNAGIFISMEELLRDLAAHNIQNRTIAFVENGSWAPTSGKLMREIMSGCKNMRLIDRTVSLRSSLKAAQDSDIDALVDAVAASFADAPAAEPEKKKKGFVCKICGYIYEGEELPPDFVCPICKHGAEFFEPIK